MRAWFTMDSLTKLNRFRSLQAQASFMIIQIISNSCLFNTGNFRKSTDISEGMSPTLRAIPNFWGWMHNKTCCNQTDTTYSYLLLPCYHLPHWLWIFPGGSEQRRLLSISEWILLWTWYWYQYRMIAVWTASGNVN